MQTTDGTTELFRKAFNLPEGFTIEDSMRPRDVPGWDSLGQLILINTIEEALGFPLEDDDVLKIDTVGSVRHLLAAKGVF